MAPQELGSLNSLSVLQVALLRQGTASGRLVVLVQALTTPALVAAAAIDSQPAGSFVQGSNVPDVLQVCLHILFDQSCCLVFGCLLLTLLALSC